VEVILLEEVTGLGRRGATVKVSPGYARNYLLPRKLAVVVAGNAANLVKTLTKQRETRDAKLRQEARTLAARIQGTRLTLAARASEEGVLFGSVQAQEVSDALAKQGFDVDKRHVRLEEHIKHVGEHEVAIQLHGGVNATVTVEVVAE